jgi:hypothetical protein
MKELSRQIETVQDTDYDNVAVTYKKITPVFNGVVDGFVCSYPDNYDIATAKDEIKAKMTAIGIVWDTEV